MSNNTIVLVHGFLGHAPAPWGVSMPSGLSYFRGVAQALEAAGHTVVQAQLPNREPVAERARVLAELLADPQRCPGQRLHLVAHSMGGLDALAALHQHPQATDRVCSVAALGTPFLGSPVADTLSALPGSLPWLPMLGGAMTGVLSLLLAPLGPALQDLTTRNATLLTYGTPRRAGVRWITIAGRDAREQPDGTLFKALSQMPLFNNQANDGLVPRTSVHLPGAEVWPDWPADHAQLVGWSLPNPLLPSWQADHEAEHLARYVALAQRLVSGT